MTEEISVQNDWWKKTKSFIMVNLALSGVFFWTIFLMHFDFIVAEIYINTQRQNMAYSVPIDQKKGKP